jgi:predicted phosphodiesterase
MKLGILADIHEDVERLLLALQHFRGEGVEQVVLLGDVFDSGERLDETVRLLAEAGVIGVWGNHDLGLCHEPENGVRDHYAGPVLNYMQMLRPRLELEGCLFTHGLPFWDATDPVVYYLGEKPESAEGQARTFGVSDHAAFFVGHFHRWVAATPEGLLPWEGQTPLYLQPGQRYLVVVAAVCYGWSALLDTDRHFLEPVRLGR